MKLTDLKAADYNPRIISDQALKGLKSSINEFGDISVIVFNKKTKNLVAGHQRIKSLVEQYGDLDIVPISENEGRIFLPSGEVFVVRFVDWNIKKEKAANIAANNPKIQGEFTPELNALIEEVRLEFEDLSKELMFEDLVIPTLENENESEFDNPKERLIDKFIIPPFSIFDTRQGYWQDRKKAWISLGIQSEVGREKNLTFSYSAQGGHVYELRNKIRAKTGVDPSWEEIQKEAEKQGIYIFEGTSIFDPVLTEVVYKWFCTSNGKILDPFAGGSVRGVVAGYLGYNYTGIDLREEQVEANINQAETILNGKSKPQWICGNSLNMDSIIEDEGFDFLFSCPPYFDLEVYSESDEDLSNMNWDEFKEQYSEIIRKGVAKLNDNRFACFVVGDIRDKNGIYRNFVDLTKEAFIKAGANFYNEIILINVAGSLPIRITKQFQKSRKVGKMHQNVLVFYKGDPKEIDKNYKEIEVEELEYAEN